MKKLVIFDLDGTLLDTIADLAESANYALKQLDYPTHPVDAIRTFVGNGINKLLERALPAHEQTEENIMRMRSHFVPYYDIHNADLSTPYPGIVSLLEDLQAKGILIAVASNKYQEATVKLVKQYFPNIDFVEILGQREGINVKPDPSIVFDLYKTTKEKQEREDAERKEPAAFSQSETFNVWMRYGFDTESLVRSWEWGKMSDGYKKMMKE